MAFVKIGQSMLSAVVLVNFSCKISLLLVFINTCNAVLGNGLPKF